LTIEYSPGCLVTCGSAATAGPAPSSAFVHEEWDDGEQADAYDDFFDTLTSDERKLIYSVGGVAELLNKAFRFGHAIVESWDDDSEKTNDCD
jgi:hypothetical protein